MKKVLSIMLVCCMMLAFVPCVEASAKEKVEYLDGEWDFVHYMNVNMMPRDVKGIVFENKIQVPGAMELQGYGYPGYFYEEMGGWGQPEDDGVRSAGVYKREFTSDGRETKLVFESFKDSLTVYLNGEKLGESKLGAIGVTFDVTPQKGTNELVCVVKRDKSGINKEDNFALSGIMGSVKLTNSVTVEKNSKKVLVNENVLTVDGKEVVLKGVKYTPTHPETGDTITNKQIDKDLSLIKEYGFNAVWTSCAPEYFYAKAQDNGLYVIDEANVNLANADRDMDTAKKRVQEMIERHFGYDNIIMWSVGSGVGGQQLINAVKELDSRPVAQEVTFAPDFKIFGNTGGMAEWVDILGKDNVGGFVDEFADKELYYTQSAYIFDVKDSVTGEKVTVDGEVENYKGVQYLGDASFVRDIENLDKYTIVTELSAVGGDRVIFESGSVKFEIRSGRARFNVGNARARADVSEGKVAAVYQDGEIQLFVNNAFVENAQADATLEGNYTIGGGDTALRYVEIYNDALTLDELLEGADKSKLISRVSFDDINIKEDKSYKFLAYGGDFGDNPNSYYKCLTGIFSSTRQPHPEAEAFKLIFAGEEESEDAGITFEKAETIIPVKGDKDALFEGGKVKIRVGYDGRITSVVNDGKELLKAAMYPTVHRENTLSEYEMGVVRYEGWKSKKAEIEGDTLYVELTSTVTDAKLYLAYKMAENGAMHVSVQGEFSDNADKPTFIGFRGVSEFEKVVWMGYEASNYPDRRVMTASDVYVKSVSEMDDGYAVPQENGNRMVYGAYLTNESEEKVIGFATASDEDKLEFQVLDYSPEAMDNADHDEDIVKDGNAYFRVGGYIAGVSDNKAYKLNENAYGYDFYILTELLEWTPDVTKVKEIYADGEEYKAFTSGVKNYVYKTNKKVTVTADGAEVVQDDKKAVIGDYTLYFAPDTEYLSDMMGEGDALISKDCDFNGTAISLRGNDYWAEPTRYDKGVTIKNGSVTYDVSDFNDHVFNAVIGKNDFDWRKMGNRGFDRSMFEASCTVTVSLDGKVVEEIKDVSMRSGSKEVMIDVSEAKEMTISVTGKGRAPQYEDAVIANAAFVPQGPIVVDFERVDSKATITVLNTDKEEVSVVLTSTENGVVTTEMTTIEKGLYRTLEVKCEENAKISAFITGLGKIDLE